MPSALQRGKARATESRSSEPCKASRSRTRAGRHPPAPGIPISSTESCLPTQRLQAMDFIAAIKSASKITYRVACKTGERDEGQDALRVGGSIVDSALPNLAGGRCGAVSCCHVRPD